MATTALAVKAGRAFRRDVQGNWVDPSPTKGAIMVVRGDDDLLHFQWKNRATDEVEDDLIVFPQEATFERVAQSTEGRTFVLKFTSSNQRHFYWMQDASPARDQEFVDNINGLLNDPEFTATWSSSSGASSSQNATHAPAESSNAMDTDEPPASGAAAGASEATPQFTAEQLARVRELVSSLSSNTGPTAAPDLALIDILGPANLNPLFTSHPELLPALFPYLPTDLPLPPSADTLRRVVESPQFQTSVASLDRAFLTGLLGNLVRGLGLPDEAGTGVNAFLKAVEDQAGRQGNSSVAQSDAMDTDH